VAAAIASGVVILYTGTGGMRADVMTDLIQGIALIVGLVILLVAVVAHMGGPGPALSTAWASAAGPHATHEGAWIGLEAWLVPIVGSITAQEMASRVLACRTEAVARRSSLLAAGLYLAVGFIPLTLGLLGARLIPGLEKPESVIGLLADRHLHGLLQILLYGALISAILSTVDSNLLSASALVSQDLLLRWTPSDRMRLRTARWLMVFFGGIAYLLAVSHQSVYGLVEEASAFGGGGMAVAMSFGLLSRIGGGASAVAAMVTSMVVQVVGTWIWPIPAPMTTSCLVSLPVYLGVAAWEGKRAAMLARGPGDRA